MNARDMAATVKLHTIPTRFAVTAVQAVLVECKTCGDRLTVPVHLGPEYAIRWADQHKLTKHTGRTALPKPIGKEARSA